MAPPLITFILVQYGWRWAFWISALMGLVAGALWYLLARDKPEEHSWVKPAELAHIKAGLPQSQVQKALTWGTIFGSKNVLAITLSYFCYGYVAYIFFAWFFIYLSNVRGLDLKSSSYYGMLPFIAIAICSPLGGWVSDLFGSGLGNVFTAVESLPPAFCYRRYFRQWPQWPMTHASPASCWRAALVHYTCHRVRFGQSRLISQDGQPGRYRHNEHG